MKLRFFYAALVSTGLTFAFTHAQAAEETVTNSELKQLKKDLQEQRKLIEAQQKQIETQQKILEQQQSYFDNQQEQLIGLNSRFDSFSAQPLAEMEIKNLRAAGVSADNPIDRKRANRGVPQQVASERKPEEEQPPEIAAYIEEGGILLKKGKMVITPELEYLNSSATRVAIEGFSIIPALNIGLFDIAELNRNTLTGAVSARLGVTNRIEIDAKIPYVYREDTTKNRPIGAGSSTEVLSRVEGDGLGDIELGAHYQMTDGLEGWPYLIGNLRFKTQTGSSPLEVDTDPATGLQTELPTGSGFYALQPSVTAIYPTDPGVFYGNLGYLFNFEESAPNVGTVNPGDSVSASLGMSLALNEQSSFSLGYSHATVFKSEINGNIIPRSRNLQVGSLDLGFAHRLNDWTSLNFNVSAGITEDAPDANVIVRVPMALDLY